MRVLMAVGVGQDAAVLVVGVVWQVALGAQRAVVAMVAVEIDLRIDVVVVHDGDGGLTEFTEPAC